MIQAIQIDTLGLVFFTALFLSLSIVPATIVLARMCGAVDVPKARSSHSVATTRLGGLGIAVSLIVSCLIFLPLYSFAWAFLAGLVVTVVTGMIDDMLDIGPRWKAVGQVAAASCFVLLGGGELSHLGDFLGGGEIATGALAIPFTIFCMVGGMNAFNLSDGLDGLAAGMAVIAAVVFAYFSWQAGAADLLLVCVALLGAVMGFLRYNNYPAKLFMGDCGSLTLGYVLAALLVSGSQREGNHVPLVAWATVVALPLLDTLLVMLRRVRYGHSPFLPDRTHLHHRLMALGLEHPGVVAAMYAAMASFGALAVALQHQSEWMQFAMLGVTGCVLFGSVSALQNLGFTFDARRHTWTSATAHRRLFGISRSMAATAVPVAVLLSLMCVPALFFPLPQLGDDEAFALLVLAGVVMVYSMPPAHGHKGMLHGAIYVSIFALFFFYNLAAGTGRWPHAYLTAISVLAAAWVAVWIVVHGNMAVLLTSGSELLMVLLSWFLPFVWFRDLHVSGHVVEAWRLACLQVLPFVPAIKIVFHALPRGPDTGAPAPLQAPGIRPYMRPIAKAAELLLGPHPQGNRLVVGVLSGSMAVVALRGLVV